MKIEFSGDRRTFIKSAAIFGGFAALLGMGRTAAAGPKQPLPQQEQPDRGYRLTEHVKKYYETARI